MPLRRHTPEQEDHGIDLAPMLDFVLNLLIFFIITTSFVKEAGVVVTRPGGFARPGVVVRPGPVVRSAPVARSAPAPRTGGFSGHAVGHVRR